jgi:protein-S-isoprenylcysteine O-methyltransferase Ste14
MNAVEISILATGTIFLVIVTWSMSVKARRYHGIYRFFSVESILILLLLNWRYWFLSPFSLPQVFSWIALVGSIVPGVEGFRLLHIIGKPMGQFENTTTLVRVGAYKYIRHPLYLSLILLGLGIFLKHLSAVTGVLFMIDLGALIATARREEKEMIEKFGAEYDAYMQTTKMFIPYVC